MRFYLTILLYSTLFNTCLGISYDGITDETNNTDYQLYDYYIDEFGNEGIIIMNYDTLRHSSYTEKYIIVLSLDETVCKWSETNIALSQFDTRKTLQNDNYGLLMNQRAYYYGIENFPAFAWCHIKNKTHKIPEVNSWKLPSAYEVDISFLSLINDYETINLHILRYNGTPIDPHKRYWLALEPTSSTESITGEACFYCLSESEVNTTNKEYLCSVRAIKYVKYETLYKSKYEHNAK